MFRLDDAMPFNANRVAILFRRELIRCFRDYGISPEQWQVLATLWLKNSLTQVEIMEITLQDAPATSKMIAKMAERDLVTVTPAADDKRKKIVTLTKKSKKLQNILPQKLVAHFEKLFENFAENKQKELLSLLQDLRRALGDLQ